MANGRESWIAGQGRRNVEDARRKAAANTPQVLMSQTPEWYKDRENLSRTKDVLQHIPAVTTDQNEKRNMYQMLMNQMKGGDKGARLIDTRGLPEGARRIGRTLFTDPAKSQGFLKDLRSMVGDIVPGISRRPNPAAVRAPEYNPFPKAGFGKQFYKDEFPWASAFSNFMGLAEKAPTFNMISKLFSKKERTPLERDSAFTPVPGSADWESSIFDMNEVIPQKGIAPLVPEHIQKSTLWGINQAINEGEGIYGGRGELPPDFDYEELRKKRRLDYDLAELMEEIMAGEVETEEDTKELPEDKKAELEALLLSPEFQALSQYEKEERLKEYGIDDLTPDLLEVQ